MVSHVDYIADRSVGKLRLERICLYSMLGFEEVTPGQPLLHACSCARRAPQHPLGNASKPGKAPAMHF